MQSPNDGGYEHAQQTSRGLDSERRWLPSNALHELLELPPHGPDEEREVAGVVQILYEAVEGCHGLVAFVHCQITKPLLRTLSIGCRAVA